MMIVQLYKNIRIGGFSIEITQHSLRSKITSVEHGADTYT